MSGAGRPLRIAAIDCGTNSLRLLIADVDRSESGATLTEVDRQTRVVRLGEGVDATGSFAAAALARVAATMGEYAELIRAADVDAVRMVATSAARDVSNRDDFLAIVAAALTRAGHPDARAEVIDGHTEAQLSFAGATSGLTAPANTGPPNTTAPNTAAPNTTAPKTGASQRAAVDHVLVVDLGGGSTELVLGERGVPGGEAGRMTHAYSANIGCVRLAERELRSDPPNSHEIDRAFGAVEAALAPALLRVPIDGPVRWVGVAGTFTTLAALCLGLESYDRDRIHLARIPIEQLVGKCRDLLTMTTAQRGALGPMHPGRADVIAAGAVIVIALARHLAAAGAVTELVVSEFDILDGIAADLAARD